MENVNIKSSLINSKPFENLKQSLIEVTKIDPNPDNLKFRIHTIEYINDVSDSDDDNFFYDCLEFVRFEDPNKESVAYTWPDGRIYLNMPNKLIETKMSVWDFIYDHECLHQLWDTWDVQKKIENKLGYCDTALLNVASDCVINDYLVYYRKKTPPSIGIFPDVLKKEFGVEYDRKKDTQYTLYLKLLKLDKKDKDNLKDKAEEIEGKLHPKTVKIKQDNSSGGSGPNKQYSDDYIKGRKDAIKDVLDKKVDPLKGWKPSNTGNDEYDKGYNECMKEIEDGLKDGIEMSNNSNGGGGSEDGLPKIPWDVENNDKNNDSNGSNSDSDSKNSDDAQDAANKAQDAANKAQDAANKAQKESKDDPSNKQKSEAAQNAQNAANKAKEAAKQAKAAADKAKAAKSKGDSDAENKHAQEAINKAKEAEQAAESAKEGKDGTDGNNSGNPLTSNDAKQAAKKARDAADKAKQAAAKASGDKKEKAKKEAERAEKAAQEAEEAAQASEDAKKNGDKKLEDKLAQDAIDKAKLAEDCANAAEEISQGLDGNNKLNNTNQDGGKQAGKGGHVEPKIFDEKIAAASKKVIDKYKNKLGGTFGEFIKRCKESIACNDNGLAVDVQVGKNSWHDDLNLSINTFVKKKVFQKKREYESTYKRIKRGSGYVKPGQPLLQGRQIRQNKMPLNIALYVDVSYSMNSVINGVFKSLYAICDAINKRFGKEEVISETLFRTFIFNDRIKEIPYGKVANASGSTISLDDLCEYIYKKSGDYLINIIITDANFNGINEQKVTKIVEENENLLVFVTNEHNQQVKNLADKFDTKIVYIFADDNFAE